MKLPEQLFHIDKEHLKGEKIFPFHLYVHNPQSNSYTLFLTANSPVNEDKEIFIDYIIEKGGELAIDRKQQRTFLSHMTLKEEDIPSLNERPLTEEEKERVELIKELKKQAMRDRGEMSEEEIDAIDENTEVELEKYDLKSGLKMCLQMNNFMPMIMAAQSEILLFELTISHTVSLARDLAKKLLIEDNFTNRIVAVSYFFAKNMDMIDQQTLSDLICAAFFAHLGYTQIEHSISHKPELEYSDKEKKKIRKHPGYSHHLLLKSGVEISERCKNIIFQHHERYSGSGYPSQKHGEFIDQLALILGAVLHVFEFSTGRVNGDSPPLYSVIDRIKNKTFSAGLEFDFGDKIYENLIYILSSENIKEVA
jgi:HD-GYP domain-containing protein (c-di-GMP phosphodiesterase class II)